MHLPSSRARHTAPNLQQQQIEELERKVDMILMHNSKLIDENAHLQHLLQVANQRQLLDSRAQLEGSGQLIRLRRELEATVMELGRAREAHLSEKESIFAQLEELSQALSVVTDNNQRLVLENHELARSLDRLQSEKQRDVDSIRAELENQIYENSLKQQISHKEEMRAKQEEFNRVTEQRAREWEQERALLEEQKINTIVDLEQRTEREKQQAQSEVEDKYKKIIAQIQDEADAKCRNARDQSESYVKMMLEQHREGQQNESELLRTQIEDLKGSLEERQKVIEGLLRPSPKNNAPGLYYQEVQELRQRIKQLTESFFKESQILKIKMALKHDLDVRELVKVYDGKIEFLADRITMLSDQNTKLRGRVEEEIRSKMKQRQRFEIEASKLKNYIRKMKIELESYGKEMRLNIEGIRDQANSFSMSILGELGTEKNKKNFYEEEMRKMREVVELKDRQVEATNLQAGERSRFYEEKLKAAKANLEDLADELDMRERAYREEIDSVKDKAKLELTKQKQFATEQKEELIAQLTNLKQEIISLQQKLKQTKMQKITATKDYERVSKQLEENKAYIEILKLQMEMAVADKDLDGQRKELKSHYERIIEQLQHDKNILKQTNSLQSSQISQLVSKYRALEKSIEQTLSTLRKKTELEGRVLELGMDNNLIKNLAEVFRRDEPK